MMNCIGETHQEIIKLYIKQMSGEIIPISYNKNKYNLIDIIEKKIIYSDERFFGYMFKVFKDDKIIEYYNNHILNDGDEISIIIFPKTFDINIVYVDKIFVGDSMSIIADRDDNAERYLLTIKQNNSYSDEDCDFYEFYFYYDKTKNFYIDNEYIDDYIDSFCNYFKSFEDIIKNYLNNIYYHHSIINNILEDIIQKSFILDSSEK